ncbi:methionyl-tRNA formyltransferase [Alphaproteobacteria bacterium]|nr:methionyl-tRNA formyltransferase [Alphaproteobacteria bacterium]
MDRVIIFLNSVRGVETMRKIVENGHNIISTIIPSTKVGSNIEVACNELGLNVKPTEQINDSDFVDWVQAKAPRLCIIAGYSQIFKKPLILVPELGTINLHAGRLPQYRGGSPLNWQILNGEKEAGISVIKIDEGIDTGPILSERFLPIKPNDTIKELHEKANKIFPEMVVDILDSIDRGTVTEKTQDETQATYWHQRNRKDGLIRWKEMSAQQVVNLVRAISKPYPGAFTLKAETEIIVWSVKISDIKLYGVPGRVVIIDDAKHVICREGAVTLLDWEAPDGVKLKSGDHL